VLLDAFRRQASPRPFDFARSVVAELAERWPLGLISNNVLPGYHHARMLARAGILAHFSAAVWSANFGRRKPDPAMLLHVLRVLRVPPHAAVFVGDKLSTDVLAAQRAGVRSIYLRRRGAPLVGRARPDFTVGDLRAVPALLRSL
jgi:putative hydrolase of the HAD superfamily